MKQISCREHTFIPGLDIRANKDMSPQAWVESLNTEVIKKRFSALGAAVVDGPKLWMLDWVDIPLGIGRTKEKVVNATGY